MASIKALIGYLDQFQLGTKWSLENDDLASDPITSKKEAKTKKKELKKHLGGKIKVKIIETLDYYKISVNKDQLEAKFDADKIELTESKLHNKRLYFKLFTGKQPFILNLKQANEIIKIGEQLDHLREEFPSLYQECHLQPYHNIIQSMLTGHLDFQNTFQTMDAFEFWKENMKSALLAFNQAANEEGKFTIVQNILKASFFNNIRDSLNGQLLKAVEQKNFPAVSRLRLMGADLNIQDGNGRSLLNIAVAKGDIKIALLLIKHGVNINELDEQDQLPLNIAASTGNVLMFEKLILMGANCHLANGTGSTPLMEACARGFGPIVKKLIKLGVDIDFENASGKTGLDLAILGGHRQVINLINDFKLSKLMESPANNLKTKVSAEEWEYAKKHCREGQKLHKKDKAHIKNIKHSFVKVNGMLYVFDAGRRCYLGQGSYKKVKRCMREDGKIFAMAIQGEGKLAANNTEKQILEDLLLREGQVVRQLDKPSPWLKEEKLISAKSYTVLAFEKGVELYKAKNNLTELDRLFIAREAAIKISELNEMGFVHRDVKPQNMMHHQIGVLHYICAIDLGFTIEMDETGRIRANNAGTPLYQAPELHVPQLLKELKHCQDSNFASLVKEYLEKKANPKIKPFHLVTAYKAMRSPTSTDECYSSHQQDVYALGVVFARDLGIKENFVQGMMEADPRKRPDLLLNVIPQIETKIATQLGFTTKVEMDHYFKVLDGIKVIMRHLQEEDSLDKYNKTLLRDLFKIYDKLENKDMKKTCQEYEALLAKDNNAFLKIIELHRFSYELMLARKEPDRLIELIQNYDGPKIKAPSMVLKLMTQSFLEQNFDLYRQILAKFEISTTPKKDEEKSIKAPIVDSLSDSDTLSTIINSVIYPSKAKMEEEVSEQSKLGSDISTNRPHS